VSDSVNYRPATPPVIEKVEVFWDRGSRLLLLNASSGSTGHGKITVRSEESYRGAEVGRQVFDASYIPDTNNSPGFLDLFGQLILTEKNTNATFDLKKYFRDAEGDAPNYFCDQNFLTSRGIPRAEITHPDLRYSVDSQTGIVTVQPRNNLTGIFKLNVCHRGAGPIIGTYGLDIASLTVVIASDTPSSWQNPRNKFDVDNDGFVRPIDVFLIVGALRRDGLQELVGEPNGLYYDVDGNAVITANDALLLVDELRAKGSYAY
jgi:hypothetical protein